MSGTDQNDVFILPDRLAQVIDPFSASQQGQEGAGNALPDLGSADEGADAGTPVHASPMPGGTNGLDPFFVEGAGWVDPAELAVLSPGVLLYANGYSMEDAMAAWRAVAQDGVLASAESGIVFYQGSAFAFIPT